MSVSVCIATYNGEAFIFQQLKSILKQLDAGDEVIISDDNSEDSTCDIIRSFNDKRITLIENTTQAGVIANFEKALKLSKGDAILLSDQDDVWFDNKVKVVLEYLGKYDVVQSDAVVVDSSLNTLHPSYFKLAGSKRGLLRNVWKNSYVGSQMAFNRKVLNVALPFPRKIPMHDSWIGFVGELFFKTFFIPQPLSYYRRHNANASTTGSKSRSSFKQKINFRLNLLKYFPLLFLRKAYKK